MQRNALAYYRENPGKLVSHTKFYHFWYSATGSTGLFGFFVAIMIQQVLTALSAKAAGVEVSRPYPVYLNLVFMTFVMAVCLWLSGIYVGSINRLQMVRELLEEQGAISAKHPDTIGIRLLGVTAGAALGGILAAGIMFSLY